MSVIQMVVIVVFERPPNRVLRTYFPGIYKHSSMIVASGSRVTWYDAQPDQFFHSKNVNDQQLNDEIYDFVVLDTSPDEDEDIILTCDACCECRIRYNQWDPLLWGIPFWYPVDCGLADSRHMNGTQSVVLILRECLSMQNPLLPILLAINSRTISPRNLKKELDTVSLTIPSTSTKRLLDAYRSGTAS